MGEFSECWCRWARAPPPPPNARWHAREERHRDALHGFTTPVSLKTTFWFLHSGRRPRPRARAAAHRPQLSARPHAAPHPQAAQCLPEASAAGKHTLVGRDSSQPTRYDEPELEGRTRRPPAVGTILAAGSSMAMARAFSVPSLAL